MMFSRLSVLNAFLTYNIFNLQWVYGEGTPYHKSRKICMSYFYISKSKVGVEVMPHICTNLLILFSF